MKKVIFGSILLMIFLSCNKSINLTCSDKNWQPYGVGDTLIFKSNLGDTVNVIVSDIESYSGRMGPDIVQKGVWESLKVNCTEFIGKSINKINTFELLELSSMEEDNNCSIRFKCPIKGAKIYEAQELYRKDLEEIKLKSLTIGNLHFDDVIEYQVREKKYSDRSDFISKIYWSKSYGYVRFDLNNTGYWMLIGINEVNLLRTSRLKKC